jgi:methionyl aminopeptidase
MVDLKSPEEIEMMGEANRIVASVLERLAAEVRPGVSTRFLDGLAEELCRKFDAVPAFKGYRGYPYALCASVNEQVVHAFPSERPLEEGDILSMDFGVRYREFFGDSAVTVGVGRVSPEAQRLMDVTRKALNAAIAEAVCGNRLSDISHAVQECAEGAGFSVVRKFVGHGIGKNLHEDPQVPNYGEPHMGMRLQAGMTLAIEPMVNAGGHEVEILDDGWTAVTKDGLLSAHFEHTIAILESGPVILSTTNGS